MNKRIKKLWIKALRSGKYKKTTDRLRRKKGDGFHYCCLGVLCELYKKDTGSGEWIGDSDFRVSANDQNADVLPYAVAEWAGTNTNPSAPNSKLGTINDSGKPFSVIADRIEKYL